MVHFPRDDTLTRPNRLSPTALKLRTSELHKLGTKTANKRIARIKTLLKSNVARRIGRSDNYFVRFMRRFFGKELVNDDGNSLL